jgi:hypothetical protein
VLLNKSGYRNCYPLGLSTKTSGGLAFDSGSLFVGEQHKYSRPLFEGAANRCVSLVNTRFEETVLPLLSFSRILNPERFLAFALEERRSRLAVAQQPSRQALFSWGCDLT